MSQLTDVVDDIIWEHPYSASAFAERQGAAAFKSEWVNVVKLTRNVVSKMKDDIFGEILQELNRSTPPNFGRYYASLTRTIMFEEDARSAMCQIVHAALLAQIYCSAQPES